MASVLVVQAALVVVEVVEAVVLVVVWGAVPVVQAVLVSMCQRRRWQLQGDGFSFHPSSCSSNSHLCMKRQRNRGWQRTGRSTLPQWRPGHFGGQALACPFRTQCDSGRCTMLAVRAVPVELVGAVVLVELAVLVGLVPVESGSFLDSEHTALKRRVACS